MSIQERERLLQIAIEALKKKAWRADAYVTSIDGDTIAGHSLKKMEKFGHEVYAIFIREDGYALATPKMHFQLAQAMYDGEWLGYVEKTIPERKGMWWWNATLLEKNGLSVHAGSFTIDGAAVEPANLNLPADRSIEGIRSWLRSSREDDNGS